MKLTPREKDKLLISVAADVARKRLKRGLKLNYPEVIAIISDFVLEGARDGESVANLMEKGGEIIPKVTKVEISERVLDTGKFKFINSCPACDTELKTIEDQAVHYCPNYKKCPPQVSGRIEHFISKNAMNIEYAHRPGYMGEPRSIVLQYNYKL